MSLNVRLSTSILLLVSTLGLAADPVPVAATGPATREGTAFWLDLALEASRSIEDPVLQAEVYGKAAVLAARTGDVPGYQRMIALAEQALRRATSRPAQSPVDDAVRLASGPVLRAMTRDGDLAGARALAEERAKTNPHTRKGSYASIAAGQVEAGDLEGALTTANSMNPYDRRTVLKQIVSTLIGGKDLAEAERIAGMMDPKDMECRDSFRAIAAARARAGQYQAALAIAERLPGSFDREDVYQSVVEAQAEAGDYAAARATAGRMPLGEAVASINRPPEYGRLQAYQTIAWKQLKRQDIAGAMETGAMLDYQRKAKLDCAIAKAQIKAGDLAAARRTAEAIPDDPGGSIGIVRQPRDQALAALAEALARGGEIAEAAQIARALRQPSDTVLDIAEVAVSQGKPDEARAVVRELTEARAADGFGFVFEDAQIPIRIARLQKSLGDPVPYDAAVASLERQVANPANPDMQRMAAAQLFGLYVHEGKFDEARRVAAIVPPGLLDWGIALVAVSEAKEGRVERAKAFAELMSKPADRTALLQSILSTTQPAPAADADRIEQIRQLPSAYDRSRAYLDRAQEAWVESEQVRK